MLEDYTFLHSGLEGQGATKPIIYIVLTDINLSVALKEFLENTFSVNVTFLKDTEHLNETKSLFLVITEDNFKGLELTQKLKDKNLSFKSILLTKENPISLEQIKSLVIEKLKIEELPQKNSEDNFFGLVGLDPKMKEVFSNIRSFARESENVLISGPSGSGKSSVAKVIQKISGNPSLYEIDCKSSAYDLEIELFDSISGKLDQKGIIYLKDIDALPLLIQAKLVKNIKQVKVGDLKILASTCKNLIDLTSAGDFRKDLLQVFNKNIHLPSLNTLREDLPNLIDHFQKKFAKVHDCAEVKFDDSVLEVLKAYEWPGNIGELSSLIERLVILHGGNPLSSNDLKEKYLNEYDPIGAHKVIYALPDDGIDLRQLLRDIEGSLIKQALAKTGGNKNRASKLLQINRTTLVEKLKKKKWESTL